VFSGGFRRSSLFGLLGVIAVAAIVVVIAFTTGEGQTDPKATYALIFGVLAVFMVILFALQRRHEPGRRR
jgi:peptidoglycan/LPS O-acetylase OafA/YrhL